MSSGFKIDISEVTKAALNAMTYVKTKRKTLFDLEVDKKMKTLFFPPKTREEAETRVAMSMKYKYFQHCNWEELAQAESLLKATSICFEDFVYLSRDDAAFVAEWSYKKEGE